MNNKRVDRVLELLSNPTVKANLNRLVNQKPRHPETTQRNNFSPKQSMKPVKESIHSPVESREKQEEASS